MILGIQMNQMPPEAYSPLSYAAIRWGDPKLVKELERLEDQGHSEMTIGAILGTETEDERRESPYCRILDRLRVTLIEKLKAEELVAVAFTSRSPPDSARSRIHPGRWRVLQPDFANNTARGAGLELFDIVVGMPTAEVEHTTLPEAATSGSVEPSFVLFEGSKSVRRGLIVVKLQNRTYQLLRFLACRVLAGNPLTTSSEIYQEIYASAASEHNVRNMIHELRRKLAPINAASTDRDILIETRFGQGYSLKLTADQVAIE